MKDTGIMRVFGPARSSHVYLLFLLPAMSHYIRPLCGGKRIGPVPVLHFKGKEIADLAEMQEESDEVAVFRKEL